MTTTQTETVHWNGNDPGLRVAREVPAPVVRAIVEYEHARQRWAEWNKQYMHNREPYALNQCIQYGCLMDSHWRHLEALLPMETGWYPHAGRLYGYAKRSWRGLELVRQPGSSAWPDPARAGAWDRAQREEERARGQLAEFCAAHKGAIQ